MLQAQGISHTFAGQRTPALTDVSFALEAGECVALIGPNGCGKSTLARSLGGAIQPTGGTVLLDGVPPQDAWWRVGMVSQDARSQLVNEVVYDEVAFGPRNMALSEEEVDRRVREALATCDLSEYVAAQVLELSGGEQQRLALAGILAVDPQHVILDEYSAHLDEGMRLRLRELLEDLKRRGKAILVVTHLVEEVLPADRVVLMQEGAIAWQGSVDELLASEELLGKSGLCRTPRLEVLSHTKQAASRYATHGSFSPKENVLCTGLQLQNVWAQAGKSFSLKDISLRVTPGKVTLVAGLPGAGKTTMLQVSAGVLAPESGEALLDYEPIVLGEVAFCRQHPEEQLFCASVLEDVAYGPQCVGMSSEEANERATAALETMGVGRELWDRSPFSLSGGERRRVAIAGILALQQKAIVLDEPTAGLDDEGCALLFDTVRNLASRGVAVLVTSHDVDLWLRYADVVALMRDGRIVYQGTAARVSKDPQAFVQAGLAVPFSVAQQQEGDAPNLVGSAEKSREVRKVKGGPMANLPPVVKVWGLVAATIAVFMTSNPLVLAAMVTASGLLCAMAGMRPKNALRALKSVGIVLALSLLANAVILDGSGDVSLVGPLSLSTTGMVRGVCTVARIVVLVLLVAVVAHSTTTGDIANALLAPLGIFERLGMHTANARLAVTLALRCVPLSMETFRSVEMAQRTRGAQIGIGGLKERLSSWIAVLVPMVVVLMQRADDLGDALTLRGFGRTYGEEGTDDE